LICFLFIYLFNRDHTVKHSHNTEPVTDAQHIEFIANANLQLLSLVGHF